MDIHKPKPWHNWREFLKELGTIALGVGIALAAEQGVEWLHWRAQVAAARETVATEMASNVRLATLRLRSAHCRVCTAMALDAGAARRHFAAASSEPWTGLWVQFEPGPFLRSAWGRTRPGPDGQAPSKPPVGRRLNADLS